MPPPTALLLPSSTPSETLTSLALASTLLRSSALVAFPTETVYGLGASALSPTAVSAIYAAKGRPSDNPLIVHVASREMLYDLIPRGENGVPALYEPLMKRFWPGPLTLIFPLGGEDGEGAPKLKVAPQVTCGLPSLAVRMPSHPLALALIKECGLPLAAPSANMSSRPSPTTAQHVFNDLGTNRGVGAILDGGSCQVGLESTVVDLVHETGELRVLRAGGVSVEELEMCLREAGFEGGLLASRNRIKVYKKDFVSSELEKNPTTPGMKYKHYSPTNSRVLLIKRRRTKSSSDNATSLSSSTTLPTLSQLILSSLPPSSSHQSIGLMLTDETFSHYTPPLPTPPPSPPSPLRSLSTSSLSVLPYSLGSTSRPIEAAQRLFSGLRYFDSLELEREEGETGRKGVDLIMLECVEEVGVGLAVMERARKAAGGVREIEFGE